MILDVRRRWRTSNVCALHCLLFLVKNVVGDGTTTFQCPNGSYLSKFGTAFDGRERLYKFGCSRFHGAPVSELKLNKRLAFDCNPPQGLATSFTIID
jgi:hypothetical protein